MADAHERELVEPVRNPDLAEDHENKQKLVRVKHTSKVDLDQFVVVHEAEVDAEEHLQQHEERVNDDLSRNDKCHHSRRPSTLARDNEGATAVAALTKENGNDEMRTDDSRYRERLAAAEGTRSGEVFGESDKISVTRKTGQSRLLLLPPHDASTDGAIQEINTRITIGEGRIRVTNDSLCSPTAFSVAATAASLTCSSPPSCTSLGDGDILSKTSAEGEATERAEDVQRQNVVLPFPQRQETWQSEKSVHAVGSLHQERSLDSLQLHQPRTEQRNLAVERANTHQLECEARRRHNESQNGSFAMLRSHSDHLLLGAGPQTNAGESSGDDEYEQKRCTGSPHIANITARGEESHSMSETCGPSSSLDTPHSHVSVGETERAPHLPSATAGEDEVKALVATTSAVVTAGLRTAVFASDQTSTTTTTTRSSRSSTLPWGDVDLAGQRFNLPSTEADLSCSQPDAPACCFCSSIMDIAFPPAPARLVTKFIAYVFEPQLQRLQRRLQEDAHQRLRGELLCNCNGVETFQENPKSTASLPAHALMSGSPAAEVAKAGLGNAAYPESATTYARDRLTASERLLKPCPLQGKQAKRSACANHSGACNGYICSSLRDEEAEEDASHKLTSTAMHGECKPGDSAPSTIPCTPLTKNSRPNGSYTASSCIFAAHSPAMESRSTVDAATPAATVAAVLEKPHQSALLALQLKQHLLSLVCYMERLLKRSRPVYEESVLAQSLPPIEAQSSEGHTPDVFHEGHCRRLKDNEDPITSSRTCGDSKQFSFHIEQLLRAEIVVQPVFPVLSQAKSEWAFSTPTKPDGRTAAKFGETAESDSFVFTKTCALAGHFKGNDEVRADPALREKSHNAGQPGKATFQKRRHASEHEDARTFPAGPPKSPVQATKTAESKLRISAKPGRANEYFFPDMEDPVEKDIHMKSNGRNVEIVDPASKSLAKQGPEERFRLSDTAPVGFSIDGELLPRAPEDIVLLGAPPSMVNYLIIFSPLLVLQALQQIAGPTFGESLRSCNSNTISDGQPPTGESSQEAEKADEKLLDSLEVEEKNARFTIEQTTNQDLCASKTAVPGTVISQSLPFAKELSTRRALESDTCGEKFCTATITGRHAMCRSTGDREESKQPGTEGIINSVPGAVLKVAALGSETAACGEKTPVELPAVPATARIRTTTAAKAEKETIGARSKGSTVAHNRAAISSSALQAELRSALCWADRGLVSLFRASSSRHAASSASCTCVPSIAFHSHNSNTARRQTITADADEKTLDEVTPESLTAAMLLLTKAVKQSQCGRTGEVRRCAVPPRDRGRCTNEAVSATDERLATKRLHSASLSHSLSEPLSFLATMLDEVDYRQLQQLWKDRPCEEHPGKAVPSEMQSRQKEAALEEDERASSPVAPAYRNECAEAEAGTDAIDISRMYGLASPSLLPSVSARGNGDSPVDNELACFLSSRVKEGGASVFFAPLHYQQQDCLPYEHGKRLLIKGKSLERNSLVDATFTGRDASSQGTAAHFSLPVGECEVKGSADNVERTGADDIERLALEILAQVNNAAFFQDEGALNTAWLQTDRQHCKGKSGPHIPDDDYAGFARKREGKRAGSTESDDWIREVAHLFIGRRDQDTSEKLKELCLSAPGLNKTQPNSEEYEHYPAKCCSSQHLQEHVRRSSYRGACEIMASAQKPRSWFACQHMWKGMISNEELLSPQGIKKRGYCVDGDVLMRERTVRETDSAIKCPRFSEPSRRLEPWTYRGDGHVATGDFACSDAFENQPLLQRQEMSQMTRPHVLPEDAARDKRQATVASPTNKVDRALHSTVDTEAASSAGDAQHTDFHCIEAPEELHVVNSEAKKISSFQAYTDETDFSGKEEAKEHPCAKYAGTTRASAPNSMKEQKNLQGLAPEECASPRNSPHREIEQFSTDQQTEVRENRPRSACNRIESSSSMSVFTDVQHFASNRHRGATNDADTWTREEAEAKESSTNTKNLRSASYRKESERRSFAEDEQTTQEGQAGQARLPCRCARLRGRHRSAQTVESTEVSSREKDDKVPTCHGKRHMPGVENEGNGRGERSTQSRRNSIQRSSTAVSVCSLEEEALRTIEATSRRASSAVYTDSGGRNGPWTEGNQKALLERFGSADEINAGMDTRRPMRGVYFDRTQRSWIGSFYEDRRQIKKRFKVDTYGFLKAKALAMDVRLGYERRMLRGVVGAAGCATSSRAESTAQLDSSASARNDVPPVVQVEEGREPQMLVGDDGAKFWTRSITKTFTEVQEQFSSLISQQRKGQLNKLPLMKNKSSPEDVGEQGLQADNDTWITQEAYSSSLATPPAHDASGSLSFKKLPGAINAVCREKPGENSLEWVKADYVAGEDNDNGSSLRSSYASKSLNSHVFSSGGMNETILDSENARPCGAADRQRILPNVSQGKIKLGDVECSSFVDSLDILGKRRRVDAQALQMDVGSAKTHATELFVFQSRDAAVKPTVCSETPSKPDEECLSHTCIRKTAASAIRPTFNSQSEQKKQQKQKHQESKFIEGSGNKLPDHSPTGENGQKRADSGKTHEWTGQRRAAPGGRCHAGVRKFGEGKVSAQDIFSGEYVGEKMRSVPTHTAAHQQRENPAKDDTVLVATLSEKYQHSCANLTQRNTPVPSAHLSIHHTVGSETGVCFTEDKRAALTGSTEENLWHSRLKMGYSNEGAERQASEEEDAGGASLERGQSTSTNFASASFTSGSVPENVQPEGLPHEVRDKTEPVMCLRRSKTLALLNSESIAHVDREYRNDSFSSPHAPEPDASLFAAGSVRGTSCNRACATEYWPVRPSTKRPADVAAATYVFSKKKKRPVDILCETGRGATPLFGHDLPLGVFYTSKKHAYCANWYEGKRQLKRYFPICKLGEPEARRLAIATRREAERREREARCRTGGSSFTLTACTGKKDFSNAVSAERMLPSNSGVKAAVLPTRYGPRDASEARYAGQMELIQTTR